MSIRNILSLLLALFALAFLTSHVSLADDGDKDGDQKQQDDKKEEADDNNSGNSGLAQRWLERMRTIGRRNPNEKSHDSIKSAFEEISIPASDSIALVFSGEQPKAIGTVVSDDGYILTKASELEDDLSCRLKDGRHLNAKLIGVADAHDLAMLKVEAKNLTPIEWETKTVPAIGSWLITPSIEDKPLAIGVVSVAPRRIRQTPGVLGVSLDDGEGGAKITEVMRRSAAQKAGLKKDDIVLSVNGQKTRNRESMVREIRKHKPGDKVKLSVKRGDEELDLTATLGSHFTAGPAARSNFQNGLGGALSMRRAGFEQAVQHDTVLQPHECGGPVMSIDGKAVGINIARAGRVASYALPAKLVVAVIDDLKDGESEVSEPSPKLLRINELKKQIEQMTSTLDEKSEQMDSAEKRRLQAKEVLEAAQKSQRAADEAAVNARDAMKKAEHELEKLHAELKQLEDE